MERAHLAAKCRRLRPLPPHDLLLESPRHAQQSPAHRYRTTTPQRPWTWENPSRKSSPPHLFPFSCVVLQHEQLNMKWKSHLKTSVKLSKLRCLAPTHLIGGELAKRHQLAISLKRSWHVKSWSNATKVEDILARSKVLSMAVSKYSR